MSKKILAVFIAAILFNFNLGKLWASGSESLSPVSLPTSFNDHFEHGDPTGYFPLKGMKKIELTPEEHVLLSSLKKIRDLREELTVLNQGQRSLQQPWVSKDVQSILDSHDVRREEQRERIRLRIIEEKDNLEDKLCQASSWTVYRLLRFKLQNFEYLDEDFYDLFEYVSAKLDLRRPSLEEYLEFIRERLVDEGVQVEKVDAFLDDPGRFIEGDKKTIFIYQQKDGFVSDPHVTAFVLFPGKYLEVLDSLRNSDSVYPRYQVERLYEKISEYNRKEESNIGLIEHDVHRQTTGGVCAYFAIFSALQVRSHSEWKDLLDQDEYKRITVPMDYQQMSATGSVNRLIYLESLLRRESLSESSIDASGGATKRRDSPRTVDFKRSYETDAPVFFSGGEHLGQPCIDLKCISLGECGKSSSKSLATPYILANRKGEPVNSIIEATQLEFNLWRVYQRLSRTRP